MPGHCPTFNFQGLFFRKPSASVFPQNRSQVKCSHSTSCALRGVSPVTCFSCSWWPQTNSVTCRPKQPRLGLLHDHWPTPEAGSKRPIYPAFQFAQLLTSYIKVNFPHLWDSLRSSPLIVILGLSPALSWGDLGFAILHCS